MTKTNIAIPCVSGVDFILPTISYKEMRGTTILCRTQNVAPAMTDFASKPIVVKSPVGLTSDGI